MRPTFGQRPIAALLSVVLLLSAGALRAQHSNAATLAALFEELHVDAHALKGVPLDRRIADYAFENAADVFCVAFYWDDEIRGRLPGRFQVLLLDKSSGKWCFRTLDDGDLRGTEGTLSMGSILGVEHTAQNVLVRGHTNPSAGELLVLSRDLEPKALLWGWPLFAVPGGSIVYHRSEIHFAPTHSLEIYMYDPASGVDRKIYPLKPYSQPRLAFMKKMKKAYDRVGKAWCREHNHHCDPELFDSSWKGPWAVDEAADSAAFVVTFGIGHIGREPEWPDDSVPTEDVIVTCRNVSQIERVTCGEARVKVLQSAHPDLGLPELLKLAARSAAGR